jgi:uracil phosphoribosyltransferase
MFSFLRRLPDGQRTLLDRAAVTTAVLKKYVNGESRICKPIFRAGGTMVTPMVTLLPNSYAGATGAVCRVMTKFFST